MPCKHAKSSSLFQNLSLGNFSNVKEEHRFFLHVRSKHEPSEELCSPIAGEAPTQMLKFWKHLAFSASFLIRLDDIGRKLVKGVPAYEYSWT